VDSTNVSYEYFLSVPYARYVILTSWLLSETIVRLHIFSQKTLLLHIYMWMTLLFVLLRYEVRHKAANMLCTKVISRTNIVELISN
jgi:hypothetical protein